MQLIQNALLTILILISALTSHAKDLKSKVTFGLLDPSYLAFISPNPALADQCQSYKVHYIFMNMSFLVPAIPIEDHAKKIFVIKSCGVQSFEQALPALQKLGPGNTKNGRIKISNLKTGKSFLITQQKEVIFDGQEVQAVDDQVNSLIKEIQVAAKKEKKCMKCPKKEILDKLD